MNTLVIVVYVAALNQFFIAEPKVQESCNTEAYAVLMQLKKEHPEHQFAAACLPKNKVYPNMKEV